MANNNVGSLIYLLRKEKNLTQVQLGEKIGVSGAAISHFEKGTSKPGFATVEKLSEALGTDFMELYMQALVDDRGDIDEQGELMRKRHLKEYKGIHVFEQARMFLYRQSDFIAFILDRKKGMIPEEAEETPIVHVMQLPGIEYSESFVLEIQGNSMAPRYPDGSRYVLSFVEDKHWQYATGVHAIWLKNKKLLIKRIGSNKNGMLMLQSDATGDQTTVEIARIEQMWRAGQAIHLPPEEL